MIYVVSSAVKKIFPLEKDKIRITIDDEKLHCAIGFMQAKLASFSVGQKLIRNPVKTLVFDRP